MSEKKKFCTVEMFTPQGLMGMSATKGGTQKLPQKFKIVVTL
jgi:hypothetical protein